MKRTVRTVIENARLRAAEVEQVRQAKREWELRELQSRIKYLGSLPNPEKDPEFVKAYERNTGRFL